MGELIIASGDLGVGAHRTASLQELTEHGESGEGVACDIIVFAKGWTCAAKPAQSAAFILHDRGNTEWRGRVILCTACEAISM